jgi:hypothetical protein
MADEKENEDKANLDTYHDLILELRQRELAVMKQNYKIEAWLAAVLKNANFTIERDAAPRLRTLCKTDPG